MAYIVNKNVFLLIINLCMVTIISIKARVDLEHG
jgi:hypothetical protein